MDTFYIIVLSIAATLLILVLTYIGIQMRNKSAATAGTYPPVQSTCPDYWEISTDGANNIICKPPNSGRNIPSSGYDSTNTTPGYKDGAINFADAKWSANGSVLCGHRYWANQYNVVWDGVSNTNAC